MSPVPASTPLRFLVLGGGTLAAWVGYDYNTCHPMRKMHPYNFSQGCIRLHNAARPGATMKEMSLEDLSKYNGEAGRPVYFASDGWVWDASNSEMFSDSYGMWKGKEASVALAKMSMDPNDVNRMDWDSLSDAELKSLRSWTTYFMQKYMIRGRLKEYQARP